MVEEAVERLLVENAGRLEDGLRAVTAVGLPGFEPPIAIRGGDGFLLLRVVGGLVEFVVDETGQQVS